MKKFWFWLFLLGLLSLAGTTTHANDCKQVEFPNWWRVCVNIEKESSDTFQLETDIERWNWALRCAIYPQTMSHSEEIQWCNGEFEIDNPKEQDIKIYIRFWSEFPSDREWKPNSKWLFPQWMYDFDDGERSDNSSNNNDDDENWDINDFQVTTDDSSPDTYQRVDLRIKARDDDWDTVADYRGTIRFEVYYRTSSSSSWTKTTSSTYFELKSSYDNTYTFRSSDNGYAILYDAIRFNRDYEYKVKVIDDDSSSIYGERIFDVGDNSSWIYGFTSTEIANIQKVYNLRDDLINSLKKSSSKLRYNQTRINLSNDLKKEMGKILDDDDDKEYDDYEEFWAAFNYRYSYTLRNK